MVKVKHERTADCVVAGFRWHRASPEGTAVGSLMLGLYGENGVLQHVGVCGAFSAARRRELIAELEPYRTDDVTHPWGGGPAGSRASRPRPASLTGVPAVSLAGTPARTSPGSRCVPSSCARSPTTIWKAAGSGIRRSSAVGVLIANPPRARYDQLDRPVNFDLASVFSGS